MLNLKSGILAVFMLGLCLTGWGGVACAQEESRRIAYKTYFSPSESPLYALALKAMMPLFENDVYHYLDKKLLMYPTLKIAEADIDGDGYKEIIAGSVEDADEIPVHCTTDNICPFYIIQIRGEDLKVLGEMKALTVGLMKDGKNRFYKIKAYQDKALKTYVPYRYDTAADKYVVVQ